MKMRIIVISVLGLALAASSMRAATITWTNAADGDWNDPANWSPNQAPVSGDDVVITNAGTYSVTNAPSVTLDSLVLGGTNGNQTLTIASLTLNNASMVNSNGVLNWGGGDLVGALTILQGGTFSISNSLYFDESPPYNGNAALTNYGTVIWAGTITSYANEGSLGGSATIDNAGLWEAVGDNTIAYETTSTNFFINTGTLEKTGGTGASTINWGFISSGMIQTTSGSFNLNWNGPSILNGNLTLNGTITTPLIVASNAVLNLASGDLVSSLTVLQGGTLSISNTIYFDEVSPYTNSAALTNYGTVIWAGAITSYANEGSLGGSATIDNAGLWEAVGDNTIGLATTSTNLFINTGTLEKIGGSASTINWNFINNGGTVNTSIGSFSMGNWIDSGLVYGNATFSGGTIAGTLAPGAMMNFSATINATLTVSSNAVANWNGGDLVSSLTVLQGGTLSISNTIYFDEVSPYTNSAALTNYGTVIWAGTITSYANEGSLGGSATIDNAGLWEAVGDNTIGLATTSTNLFINTGTLEKIGGSASTINWNFASTGTIDTSSGAFTLDWNGLSTLHGLLTLAGSTLTFPLIVASNAVLNLASGDLVSSLTVLQGGTLSISNTIYFDEVSPYTNSAALTNYGTVIWAGNIASYANEGGQGGSATIDNAGLWESVGDNSITALASGGTNTFINTGTLEKIGGTGATTISWDFDSIGGTLETPIGYFSLSGNWNRNNLVYGNANVSGTIGGIIGSNAVFNWEGGDLEGTLTVAQGGTLSISNTIYFDEVSPYTNNAALTNDGTVIWAGNITSYANEGSLGGSATIDNAGLWGAVGDNTIGFATASTNFFINTGTLKKIGGAGASTINWNFINPGGVAGSQTNTLSLAGSYDLTGGTLNVGINSPGNYGIIHLSGSPAALAGSFSANFNNGYVAATGSSFPVLTYSAKSGTFTNFNLPFAVAWQTNYGGAAFTLTVLNVRPTLAAIANQNIAEVTPLNVTASATDPDSGQTLTFALVSMPGSMTINPATGAISWTPAQTQSPSTNTVSVSVTDNGTPPLSATNSFVVTVYEVNNPPIPPLIPTQTVNAQALLTVNDTATETNIHATVGYFLLSAPASAQINSTGIITWTPFRSQGPSTNLITAVATNSDIYDLTNTYLNATNSFTVIVYAPTLAPIGNYTVNPGQTVAFNASATDNDSTRTLTFSLISPPNGPAINSASGAFHWRPSVSQANTTNIVQLSVTDNSTPSLSDTKSFMVVVNPLAPVILTPISFTNGQFKFQVSGTTGPDYIITASTNVSGWSDTFTNLSPSTPFQYTDTNALTFTNRFYRVRLSP